MTHQVPKPAYLASEGSPIHPDRALYTSIANAPKELVESFTIPIRSGRAWVLPKGNVCRINTLLGPQVGDLNLWSLHNPRERFWAARTRQLHRSHVSVFDRLWSCLPYLRPLVTITGDSLSNYGVDGVGGRVHDILGLAPFNLLEIWPCSPLSHAGQDATPMVLHGSRKHVGFQLMPVQSEPNTFGGILRFPLPFEPD